MQPYQVILTIPASTVEIAPATSTIKLEKGILHRMQIAFPWGCAENVHVVVDDRLKQISPWNEGESWAWNDFVLDYEPNHSLNDSPFELVVKGWSDDVRHSHRITFRFFVDPTPRSRVDQLIKHLFSATPGGRV